MRRRTLRMIRRAGTIAPMLVAVAAHAQAPAPAAKDGRGAEAAPAAARLAPTPGDVAAADPVGAAFALFSEPRADRSTAASAKPAEAVPAAVEETAPGVVTAERGPTVVTDPTPADATAPLGYAAAAPTVVPPVERLLATVPRAESSVAGFVVRPIDVPLPRRRPVDGPAAGEGEMRLASLAPEPVAAPAAAAAPIAAETAAFGEPNKIPRAAEPYMALIRREAAANKVPLWLAVGVGWVESKYQPNLRGSHGVVGLMQVMPSTARFQGYRGPTEKLLEPETNIVWGMKELGWTWKDAKGDACLAIAKYKGGIRTKSISPAAADYCKRAKAVTGMG